ncbi:MAG: acyl-CoA thioesterase [Candidatus Cloacimonetes bacterium]|nr:acyl-CoA thioesterase [Candidatus Cloacimonadota bacterium]
MELVYKRRIWGFECDIYGHLNNAQYLHLYEEARSEALREIGITIEDFRRMGVQIVITRVELEYKRTVPFDEVVEIRTRISFANRLRSTWEQRIFSADGTLCNHALIEGVYLREGRPHRISHEMVKVFGAFLGEGQRDA